MRVAFSRAPMSLQGTAMEVRVRAGIVHFHLFLQHQRAKRLLDASRGQAVMCIRCWDDTPAHMSFGALSEDIAPCARYYVPDRLRKTFGKCLATWKESLVLGIKPTNHGVLDLFVQHMTFVSADGQGFSFLLPPRVLRHKTAGIIFAAVDSVADSLLSTESILRMSDRMPLVFILDVADSVSANRKAIRKYDYIKCRHIYI